MLQNGKTLSMHSNAIYKGDFSHNGTLLKLHENSYTIGYSALLSKDGTQAGTAKFGSGVFMNLAQHNNNVYTGIPTATGAIPAFGGIMVREPAIASGYPVLNDEVSGFQNGLLCREGYVVYKKADVVFGASEKMEDVEVFNYVYQNFALWVRKSDGSVYFTPKQTVYETSGDIFVGRVCEMNPDDLSVTVYITPSVLADTTDITGATPTVTAGTATKNSVPLTITLGTEGSIKVLYKKTADTDYIDTEASITLVYDETGDNYKAVYTVEGLTASTAYTFKVEAITPCGLKSATATATTSAS